MKSCVFSAILVLLFFERMFSDAVRTVIEKESPQLLGYLA